MQRMIARLIGLLFLCGLMLATTTAHHDSIFVDGRVYFVDADCYSRMSRVQQVLKKPLHSIRHHDFENYPQGVTTHTTAPLDWLIALLAWSLTPFSSQALDLAGAWISPLLGIAMLIALWIWMDRGRLPFCYAMLTLIATSPISVQAFRLGRPDHQSLLLFLIAVGFSTEWTLWSRPSRLAAIIWGIAWGLALWTSLYEPLIFFGLLFIVRFAILQRHALSQEWQAGWMAALGTFGVGALFDGWRFASPSSEMMQYFTNWSQSIAELAHLPPLSPQFLGWLGWLAPILPILLAWRFVKVRAPHLLALIILLLVTYALTCWQLRWGCYLALTTAMALPFALPVISSAVIAWIVFVVSLFPLAQQWDALLYPNKVTQTAWDEQRLDYQLLREAANWLASRSPGGVLAPWWLCPTIAYWSGQFCVAGSSHQSLPGTVDTARFYLTTQNNVAREILIHRNVRYVVAYEPSRVLSTATILLKEPVQRHTFGELLYNTPAFAPPWLTMVYSNAFFKIYEVKNDEI